MTLKVGVTGGIGSGKSTVCRIFKTLGIPIYNADRRAKELMEDAPEVKAAVLELLGAGAYGGQGLDTGYIAKKVFANRELLDRLNAIVHPAVFKDTEEWFRKQSGPYAIKEAALIVETGGQQALDHTIFVYAPESLRIDRVVLRDNVSSGEVKDRMDKQMPDAEKMKHCDLIIVNDGEVSLIRQVLWIHNFLTGHP